MPETKMRALPGPWIDLATDGIRGGKDLRRGDVVKAVRQIMLSAHRNGWDWPSIHALLTDRKRKLAVQVATGKGGRPIKPGPVAEFLKKHWDETAKVVATTEPWDRSAAQDKVEAIREAFETGDHSDRRQADGGQNDHALSELDRAIIGAVLDLATEYGTTRVAAPGHTIAARIGLDPTSDADLKRVRRALRRLADQGDWIRLAKAGNAYTRRANLYSLHAPADVSHMGRTTSTYGTPPTYGTPTYGTHPGVA